MFIDSSTRPRIIMINSIKKMFSSSVRFDANSANGIT